jgi:predicted LPLAT superfamily acyltransferase
MSAPVFFITSLRHHSQLHLHLEMFSSLHSLTTTGRHMARDMARAAI